MNNFIYQKPQSLAEAAQFDEAATSSIIAGGTNLIDLMKYRVENPQQLVDINGLALKNIEATAEGGLRLGALVTNADTAYDERVEQQYPVLSKTILAGASAQLRNMATNGGNLFQRTRCYYFYDTATPCNKREPGSGCSAINGFNRIHAILGENSNCIATHPSDMCVALTMLDAQINITGTTGERTIPILDLHRLPGNTPELDHNLRPGEVVTSIDLPETGFADHYEYLKIRDRESYAFALVSVAAGLELNGDSIEKIHVALGGVAHKPWRSPKLEQEFVGQPATEATFQAFADRLTTGATGYGDNNFKIKLTPRAIVRALTTAKNRNND